MTKTYQFFNSSFERIFSDANQKHLERATLWLSIIGFIIHLILIYSKKFNLFHTPFEARLLDDPISAIYTPFSIILVYEIYLLIVYLPRSFTTAVSKQFEIISLILIRRVFGDIPNVELNVNWFENLENLQLIYDLTGIVLLYFLIYLFNRDRQKLPRKAIDERLHRFVQSKRMVSVVLLPILILTALYSVWMWTSALFNVDGAIPDINAVFYNE